LISHSGGHRFTERQQGWPESLAAAPASGSVPGVRACLRLKLADPAGRLPEHPPRFAARSGGRSSRRWFALLDEAGTTWFVLRPRGFLSASRRLGRYFDPGYIRNAGRDTCVWDCSSPPVGEHGSGGDGGSRGKSVPPRRDTLYLACLQPNQRGSWREDPTDSARNKLSVIGWFCGQSS